jgi:O-antigen/teichoic acid export membrane protein
LKTRFFNLIKKGIHLSIISLKKNRNDSSEKPPITPEKICNIRKSKFVQNVLIVATGTAAAQGLSILFSPIITRIYSPEAFGILGSFVAIGSTISTIAAFSFPIAIVLPKQDEEAKDIAHVSFFLSLIIAFLTGFVLFTLKDWITTTFGLENISSFFIFLPLVIVFSVCHEIAQQWLIRKKQFKITARAAVLQTLIVNTTKVSIGWFHPMVMVLIVITSLSSLLHAALLIWPKRVVSTIIQRLPSFNSVKYIITKYYDFPLFRSPQIFLNAASQNVPVLLLAAHFGPARAGFFELSRRVLSIPIQILSKSVGDVFYPRITEAIHAGENSTQLLLKATFALCVAGCIPFTFIIFFGPQVFRFVFGSEWSLAGEYARWLGLWIFIGLLNRPSISAIPALSMQAHLLAFEIFSVILRIGSLYAGFHIFHDDLIAIILFSFSGVILNLVLISAVIFVSTKRNT